MQSNIVIEQFEYVMVFEINSYNKCVIRFGPTNIPVNDFTTWEIDEYNYMRLKDSYDFITCNMKLYYENHNHNLKMLQCKRSCYIFDIPTTVLINEFTETFYPDSYIPETIEAYIENHIIQEYKHEQF